MFLLHHKTAELVAQSRIFLHVKDMILSLHLFCPEDIRFNWTELNWTVYQGMCPPSHLNTLIIWSIKECTHLACFTIRYIKECTHLPTLIIRSIKECAHLACFTIQYIKECTHLSCFTMYNCYIFLVFCQEVCHIFTERFDKLKRGCIVIFKRIMSNFREPLVIVRSLSFLAPE